MYKIGNLITIKKPNVKTYLESVQAKWLVIVTKSKYKVSVIFISTEFRSVALKGNLDPEISFLSPGL
jgi:hypothetical protein